MTAEVVAAPVEGTSPETPATDLTTENATLKRKLATLEGQSQALAREKAAKDELVNKLAEAERWKAEKEQADMNEFDRAQARIKTLEKEREEARAEAAHERLARKYPLAVEFLANEALPSEEKLAELNARLTPAASAEPEPERVPGNPPKAAQMPDSRSRLEQVREKLAEAAKTEVQKWSLPD
jgi:hypothetical protein